jgi:hypothetical protein
VTTACVPRRPGPMKAIDIPEDVVTRLRRATGQAVPAS